MLQQCKTGMKHIFGNIVPKLHMIVIQNNPNLLTSLGKPLEIAVADGISRRHGGVLGIVFN